MVADFSSLDGLSSGEPMGLPLRHSNLGREVGLQLVHNIHEIVVQLRFIRHPLGVLNTLGQQPLHPLVLEQNLGAHVDLLLRNARRLEMFEC